MGWVGGGSGSKSSVETTTQRRYTAAVPESEAPLAEALEYNAKVWMLAM